MPQPQPSLREQKRQETKRKIEDSATYLVDEKGFKAVTIEEICAHAQVSRRTFFNYFTSKDSAIFGSASEDFTEAEKDRFLSTPTDNLARIVIELIKSALGAVEGTPEVIQRRLRISSDADAAAAALSRKRAKSNELMSLIHTRLNAQPQLRTMPDIDPHTEAMLLAAYVREALWLASASPSMDLSRPIEERFTEALDLFHNYSKELSW